MFQALCLMLFNGAEKKEKGEPVLTFEDIKEGTGIDDKILRNTLQSLACGKVRVLRKRPQSAKVEDGDKFHFKSDFKHSNRQIKINSIQMRETKEENSVTHEAVQRDRQYCIDAAIVRIMKTRKTLTHVQLIAQTFEMLKFPAKSVDLKKRIESLIDREYIERDEQAANTYNYLA